MKQITLLLFTILIVSKSFCQSGYNAVINAEIYDLEIDKDTVLICAGNGYLYKADKSGLVFDSIFITYQINTLGDTIGGHLYDIEIDSLGHKWIATGNDGVVELISDSIINHFDNMDVEWKSASTIEIDKYGNIWAGTEIDGIHYYNGKNWTKLDITEDEDEGAYSIIIDSNNVKWFTSNVGIFEYKDSLINTYTLESYGYLANSSFIDSKGNKWIGTSNNGVYLVENNEWVNYTKDDGLLDNLPKTISEDYNGFIWCSHNYGFSVFDGKNWTSIHNEDITNKDITSLLILNNNSKSSNEIGNFWVGTKNGLFISNSITLNIDKAPKSNFKIYPNPSTDFIRISNFNDSEKTYYIYNVAGLVEKTGGLKNGEEIFIGDLINGLYFFKIEHYTIKIIKQ